jgi:hypothetical protein
MLSLEPKLQSHSFSAAKNILLYLHPINYKVQKKSLIPLNNFENRGEFKTVKKYPEVHTRLVEIFDGNNEKAYRKRANSRNIFGENKDKEEIEYSIVKKAGKT